jgi:hypothetical protein
MLTNMENVNDIVNKMQAQMIDRSREDLSLARSRLSPELDPSQELRRIRHIVHSYKC